MHHRFLFFFAFAVGVLVVTQPLFAQSLPNPGNSDDSSLLGITLGAASDGQADIPSSHKTLYLTGPSSQRIRFKLSEPEIRWVRVDAGFYSIESPELLNVEAATTLDVEVPPGSVVLAPFAVEAEGEGLRIIQLDEKGRQRAGQDLASYVTFPHWMNRDLLGFGTLRPDMDTESIVYDLQVNSVTPDSKIYLDDVFAGMAPLGVSLPSGKHRVIVRAEGYEDAVYYIRLEGDAVIDAELLPAVDEEMDAETERYRTLVGPFLHFDEPNEQLSGLFADTLLLALEADPRLEPMPATIPWLRRDALIHPDFLPMEEVGADLLVTGFFGTQNGRLTVQANLYDVGAETIRAAMTWWGTAGLDVFAAMDEIALEFAGEVDRVLPEAGRTLVTQRETVFSGRDRNQSLIARKKVILKRWSERPHTLSFHAGLGAIFDSIVVTDEVYHAQRFDGVFLPLMIRWNRDLSSQFAIGAGAQVILGAYLHDNSANVRESLVIPGFYAGPSLIFRDLKTDVLIGLNAEFLFAPKLLYIWGNAGINQGEAGPFIYVQPKINAEIRYYINQRSNTTPIFIKGGMGISPLGYRFDLANQGGSGWVDAEFLLYLGMGVRL